MSTPAGSGAVDDIYRPISCADAAQLSRLALDGSFEFTQLSPGPLTAHGGVIALNQVLVGQVTLDQTLLRRGQVPRGSSAVLIPGSASSQAFVRGHRLAATQCIATADGGSIETITRSHYVDVALIVGPGAWSEPAAIRGSEVATPGLLWIGRMLHTVRWLFAAVREYPRAAARPGVRASLTDQLLMTMADFGGERVNAEHPTRDARIQQRMAVERAREYIHGKLADPLPLSDLCRYAHVQARSLEYGFREITGLSPIAYVKSLRLNAVRRRLSRTDSAEHSITEIALDHGFWHLSQFAADYRKFFGETPTSTRQRARALHAVA